MLVFKMNTPIYYVITMFKVVHLFVYDFHREYCGQGGGGIVVVDQRETSPLGPYRQRIHNRSV